MRADYELVTGPPTVEDYCALRALAGLSPKRPDQAAAALAGSWLTVHVRHGASGATVGMGRVIGDGGWYFHLADMAVLPDHQRRGIGRAILEHLVRAIEQRAPAEPWITLLADPPGRPLYEAMGFRPTAPDSVGMALERAADADRSS